MIPSSSSSLSSPWPLPASASVVAGLLAKGGVGVIPTDTIYGIVGPALRKDAVERIYRLRKRDPGKPMIILISSADELSKFGIEPTPEALKVLQRVWPG